MHITSNAIIQSSLSAAPSSSITAGLNQPLLAGSQSNTDLPLLGKLDQALIQTIRKAMELYQNEEYFLDDIFSLAKEAQVNSEGQVKIPSKMKTYTQKELTKHLSELSKTCRKNLIASYFTKERVDAKMKFFNLITAHLQYALSSADYRKAIAKDPNQNIQNQPLNISPVFYPIELSQLETQFDHSIQSILPDEELRKAWKKTYFLPLIEEMKTIILKTTATFSSQPTYTIENNAGKYSFLDLISKINLTIETMKKDEMQVTESTRKAFANTLVQFKQAIRNNLINKNKTFYNTWALSYQITAAEDKALQKKKSQFLICLCYCATPFTFLFGNLLFCLTKWNFWRCNRSYASWNYTCDNQGIAAFTDCTDLESYQKFSLLAPMQSIRALRKDVIRLEDELKTHPGTQIMK